MILTMRLSVLVMLVLAILGLLQSGSALGAAPATIPDGEDCHCEGNAFSVGNNECCPWIVTNMQEGNAECEPDPECSEIPENSCSASWDSIDELCPSPVFPFTTFRNVTGVGRLDSECDTDVLKRWPCPSNPTKKKGIKLTCTGCRVVLGG